NCILCLLGLPLFYVRFFLTSKCARVKMSGSDTNTRLDSLLMEAESMWELTVRLWFLTPPSPISLTVAFSVLRKCPKCL
uniref:Uncharacterized protein n=1 Tax=Sinocyclocheilus rhinocerous TaxID=307959 RepID=A0A673K6P9_9TELE